MMLNSVLLGPLVYGTIKVGGVTRVKTYEELIDQEKLQDDCDVRAINIVLQGTELSQQERECKLYNEFDRFTSVKGESLHEYYLRFSQLMNDMHTIGMTMQQYNPTHYQQQLSLVAQQYYLSQQHSQSSTFSLPTVSASSNSPTTSIPQNVYQSLVILQQLQSEFSQLDSGLAVLSFLPDDDPIASLNKAMAFLTTTITSHFPTTNNQLKTSSNLRNQATIQDGRVIVQQVQGRPGQNFASIGSKSNATSSMINRNGGNNAAVQARVVRYYNFQGEGHMARQCTQPKRPRNTSWFKEKILLVQAHESGQTNDLDAFDLDCDEAPGAKAVVMANLSSYNSDVISENKSAAVQDTTLTEQQNAVIMSVFDDITNTVSKCNVESIKNKNVNKYLIAELERYKERVRMFEERQKEDLNNREKLIDSQMNDMILNINAKFAAFQKRLTNLNLLF
ncbi:hypothetical protein Tco_0751141 [Tanacetum coccineum]|uniref:Uncharacterized protein n=1 Tax=Tanacetum coccineum TaxID=301880 RepID=A0ABQ4Z3F0_9ASTR